MKRRLIRVRRQVIRICIGRCQCLIIHRAGEQGGVRSKMHREP